jgi:hypothetical protein
LFVLLCLFFFVCVAIIITRTLAHVIFVCVVMIITRTLAHVLFFCVAMIGTRTRAHVIFVCVAMIITRTLAHVLFVCVAMIITRTLALACTHIRPRVDTGGVTSREAEVRLAVLLLFLLRLRMITAWL